MVRKSINEAVIVEAVRILKADGLTASAALRQAIINLDVAKDQKCSLQEIFGDAIVSVGTDHGTGFHLAILKRMLTIINSSVTVNAGPFKGKVIKMSETTITPTADVTETSPALPSKKKTRRKKFNEGESFAIVANMGLQPTKTDRGTQLVPFQFSRKTGRDGS